MRLPAWRADRYWVPLKRTDVRAAHQPCRCAAPATVPQPSIRLKAPDCKPDTADVGHIRQQPGASTSGREPDAKLSSSESGLERKDFSKFVHLFRQASPYIKGHRGKTFIIVVPGEVVQQKDLLHSLLEDVTLLHVLGTRLVIVLGVQQLVDTELQRQGVEPRYVRGYRITDVAAMQAAKEAAGAARLEVEAYLSKALAVHTVRRHTRSSADQEEYHYGPAMGVVSGNYVTGRRRGVVSGVDFGATGSVRFVQVGAIQAQLDMGNIVLLANLAFSTAGEVLNCNSFDVGTHAAIELQADKLCCLTLDEASVFALPQWLPLNDAEDLIARHMASEAEKAEDMACNTACTVPVHTPALGNGENGNGNGKGPSCELDIDLDCWQAMRFPNSVVSAVVACKNGVKRAHLVDARTDGGLLLELYTRDGVGTMISTDFYEGIKPASPAHLDAIEALLAPLVAADVVLPRSREQLIADLPHFTVIERESKVLGCALLKPLGRDAKGVSVGELAAFSVLPGYRGTGRGDTLLDYVEQTARHMGIERLVLLTTRTADWFEQRSFVYDTYAHASALLPEARRACVVASRNSKLYAKPIYNLGETSQVAPAGKRIGF